VTTAWEPSLRYPDPAIRTLDPRFGHLHLPLAAVERLATGCRWAEGPVWFGDGRYLLWSDVPNDRILKWEGDRRRQHLSRPLQLRQWQYA
jgi:gluconolactonase